MAIRRNVRPLGMKHAEESTRRAARIRPWFAALVLTAVTLVVAGCGAISESDLLHNAAGAAGRTAIDLFLTDLAIADGLAPIEPPDDGAGPDDAGGECPPVETEVESTVSYSADIVPLFTQTGCLTSTCHGGTFVSSSYSLETYEGLFLPGSEAVFLGACPVVPGDPEASYLIEKLGPDPSIGVQMPNNRPPLTADQMDLLRLWILDGAPDN